MTNKNKDRLGFVVIVVLLFVSLVLMRKVTIRDERVKYETFLTDTIQHFQTIKANDSTTIAVQVGQIGTLEQAVDAGLIEIETLEKANIDKAETIVSLKAEIKLKDIELAFKPDTVYKYVTIEVDGDTYLKVPLPFGQKVDKWVYIDGMVKSTGVRVDSLTIKTEPTFVLGYQSQGYFKPMVPMVAYTDANPYVTPLEMQNITVSDPGPWYHNDWIKRGEGALAAIVLVKGLQWLIGR